MWEEIILPTSSPYFSLLQNFKNLLMKKYLIPLILDEKSIAWRKDVEAKNCLSAIKKAEKTFPAFKNRIRTASNLELKESIDCLCQVQNRISDFKHVDILLADAYHDISRQIDSYCQVEKERLDEGVLL